MADVREKMIKLVEAAGDKALSQHIPLTADLIADELIANGVTIPEWIPASEPPKEDSTYLVQTATGAVTTARFYAFKSFPATKHLPACHRSPKWQSNRNVVKWMPLPPKGE